MCTIVKKPKSALVSAVQQALDTAPPIQSDSAVPASTQVNRPVKTRRSDQLPDFDTLPDSGFVRLPSLEKIFACSRATIWRRVKEAKLPAPKKLGPRMVAWNVGEIRCAISAYMKGEIA